MASSKQRDVTLPAEALQALQRTLGAQVGPGAAVQALQAAGYETGIVIHQRFVEELGSDSANVSDDRFWTALSEFFSERGWGTMEHRSPHPGVGVLASHDCAEAAEGSEGGSPCSFTSGVIAGLLTKAAGGPIAVLQAECLSRGDDACTFAFGREAAIQKLYGLLSDDGDLDTALARL